MNLSTSQIDTEDVEAFGEATAGLKFESYNGGRDSRERLTQVEGSFFLINHFYNYSPLYLKYDKFYMPS